MAVVADREAVSFIAEHGGRLYLYADAAGLKRVKMEPPDDDSLRFEEIEANGFVMYVEADIVRPAVWNVKLRRLPYRRVDVLWDGQQPGPSYGATNDAYDQGLFRSGS